MDLGKDKSSPLVPTGCSWLGLCKKRHKRKIKRKKLKKKLLKREIYIIYIQAYLNLHLLTSYKFIIQYIHRRVLMTKKL